MSWTLYISSRSISIFLNSFPLCVSLQAWNVTILIIIHFFQAPILPPTLCIFSLNAATAPEQVLFPFSRGGKLRLKAVTQPGSGRALNYSGFWGSSLVLFYYYLPHWVFIAVWVLFLSCDTQGLLSLQPTGFSNWLRGLVALRHVLLHGTWDLSSLTRNRIHVPWIRRWILTIRPPEKSHKIHFCNNFFVFINLHFFLFHFVFVKLISCFPFRFWPLRK